MNDPALNNLMLCLVMVAIAVLAWGGIRTMRTDRTKGVLMLVCALVILGNLLIWTL